VPEVRVRVPAAHFDPDHAKARARHGHDVSRRERHGEARPPGYTLPESLQSRVIDAYDHEDQVPRACALAEAGWSPAGVRSWPDFLTRRSAHLPQLDALGIRYRALDR
jgi:hypothetical protein